jgi:hypothetical protein
MQYDPRLLTNLKNKFRQVVAKRDPYHQRAGQE